MDESSTSKTVSKDIFTDEDCVPTASAKEAKGETSRAISSYPAAHSTEIEEEHEIE